MFLYASVWADLGKLLTYFCTLANFWVVYILWWRWKRIDSSRCTYLLRDSLCFNISVCYVMLLLLSWMCWRAAIISVYNAMWSQAALISETRSDFLTTECEVLIVPSRRVSLIFIILFITLSLCVSFSSGGWGQCVSYILTPWLCGLCSQTEAYLSNLKSACFSLLPSWRPLSWKPLFSLLPSWRALFASIILPWLEFYTEMQHHVFIHFPHGNTSWPIFSMLGAFKKKITGLVPIKALCICY